MDLLPMISLCTLNNDFIHALSTMKDEVFQWTKPCYHSICYYTWYCKLLLYFLLTMLKRPCMVSCKPLAAPVSKPLMNANIKWQVSAERRQITKPVLIMLGRKSAKHLNQLTKLQAKESSILAL